MFRTFRKNELLEADDSSEKPATQSTSTQFRIRYYRYIHAVKTRKKICYIKYDKQDEAHGVTREIFYH